CNGIDDDCDAAIDEDLGQTTCGIGACQKTVDNCVGGSVQPCTPLPPASEFCNGIDDDCDGLIDEDGPCVSGATQKCYFATEPSLLRTRNVGVCRDGDQTCGDDGDWGKVHDSENSDQDISLSDIELDLSESGR
ncbi:MAG: hypothetical protein IH977_07585, partial [Nitrospinae bacterium]|nr:hypothetical protein [Nitrospinota bacterium]